MHVFTTRAGLETWRSAGPRLDESAFLLRFFQKRPLAGGLPFTSCPFRRRQALRSRHYDDWTIESWRIGPRLRALETDIDEPDQNPPLWKDLTLASVLPAVLWGAAAMLFA